LTENSASADEPEQQATPAPEPVLVEAPQVEAVVTPPLSLQSLQSMLNEVNMIMVTTDEQKWRAVQNEISLQPKPVLAPRERKALAPRVQESLIQVETRAPARASLNDPGPEIV
jgi:hypothetical protein